MSRSHPDPTALLDTLKFDHDLTRQAIDKFDHLFFGIRSWAISIEAALVAFSLTVQKPVVLVVAIAPSLLFWVLELMYKGFQVECIKHSRDLEHRIDAALRECEAAEEGYIYGFGHLIRSPRFRNIVRGLVKYREILLFYVGLLFVPLLGLLLFALT
jgi:hypothetical protein